ncbi:methyltransferase type 11 [Thermoplasmatales archaeon SW_10_69_26]|jgi:ubiquinone/menaquinone biosynthesis C-methylase UbiE|nr:MAG: methyltransferase type 11 [Thermoplasmatales archaeon SW_10_69_26]
MRLLDRAFDRPEGWLGRLGGWWMAHRNRETIAWTVDLLDLNPGHRVLEIGFGPGVGIEEVLDQQPGAEVSGVDPSGPMLEAARERNRPAVDEGTVDLRARVAENLPWPDASFERAFTVDTYQAWRDPVTALGELERVLVDGGRLSVGFTPGHADAAEGLTDALVRAGFQRPRRLTGEEGVCVIADR